MLLLQSMRGCTKYGEYIEYDYVCPKEVDCQFLVVSSFRRWRVSAIWTKPVCTLYTAKEDCFCPCAGQVVLMSYVSYIGMHQLVSRAPEAEHTYVCINLCPRNNIRIHRLGTRKISNKRVSCCRVL